jgi:hypothetical protein
MGRPKNPNSLVPCSSCVTKETEAALHAAAKELNMAYAAVVRLAIEKWLAARAKAKQLQDCEDP